MVKILSLLFLLLLNVTHAASLTLQLSDHKVEMGKYLTATFTYEGNTKPKLIDLDLWQDDFFIELADADLSKTEFDSIISTTKARLYPRHTGGLTLDAIALGGSFVKPQHVNARPSIRNNINATPVVGALKTHYWADESIIVSIDVPLHYARNEVIAKEWLINGFNITPLPSIKKSNNVRLQWLIFTPYKGHYQLELPAIVQRGKGRFKFHLPKLKLTIKPLPAYLPSSVSTGAIDVSSKIIVQDNHKIAQITFKKAGYLPDRIEGFQRFINTLSDNELALNIQSNEYIHQGITTRQTNITLPNWLWGRQLTLKLRYFNTQTGQMDSLEHSLAKAYTIPKQAQYIIIALGLLALLIALKILFQISNTWHDRCHFKQRIKQANNAHELRLMLLNNGQFKTLNDWAQQNNSLEMLKIRDAINQACYQSNSPSQLNEIKKALTTKLKFQLKEPIT